MPRNRFLAVISLVELVDELALLLNQEAGVHVGGDARDDFLRSKRGFGR